MKNMKLRIKACYSGTHKPDTTKSVSQIWNYMIVSKGCAQLFCLGKCSNTRYIKLTAQNDSVYWGLLRSVFKERIFSLPEVYYKILLCKVCFDSGICNRVLSALFAHELQLGCSEAWVLSGNSQCSDRSTLVSCLSRGSCCFPLK